MKNFYVFAFLSVLIASSSCAVNNQYVTDSRTKTVEAEGYGTTVQEAIDSALVEAGLEAFGMKVDTYEASVNGNLAVNKTTTKDEDSKSYQRKVSIVKYRVLEQTFNGQYKVKVEAQITRDRKFRTTQAEEQRRRLYNNCWSMRTDVSTDYCLSVKANDVWTKIKLWFGE